MPDQWLEVMVTGGFKVWHIIFIIIAVLITMTVVYCCFHRCRIPRTKQEIEADLMRSNLTNKFRDYLQELSNEPTTFVEALKKVQELEEKLEKDEAMLSRDLGARKRMGWLKLKGKDDKAPATDNQAPDKIAENLDTSEQTGGIGMTRSDSKLDPSQVVVPIESEPVSQSTTKPSGGTANDILPSKNDTKSQLEDGKAGGADDQTEVKSVAPSLGRQSRRPRRHKPNLSRSKRAREKSQGEPADFEARPPSQGEQHNDLAPIQSVPTQPRSSLAQPESPSPSPLQKERHHKLHRRHKVRKEPKTAGISGMGDTGGKPKP